MTEASWHELRAALRVACIIDESGNPTEDARLSYRYILSQGEQRARDLQIGEALLIRIGLLASIDDHLVPATGLAAVARVDENTGLNVLEAMARNLTTPNTSDEALTREEIGAIGEETIVTTCREEFISIGRPDLCPAVQRVSLVSDYLGYDVSGPRVAGQPRMLEIKTMSSPPKGSASFFISRNEYDVGQRWPTDWALVVCSLGQRDRLMADVIGWCRAQSLQPYLPEDRNGRWTEAFVKLPTASLIMGIPSAV